VSLKYIAKLWEYVLIEWIKKEIKDRFINLKYEIIYLIFFHFNLEIYKAKISVFMKQKNFKIIIKDYYKIYR